MKKIKIIMRELKMINSWIIVGDELINLDKVVRVSCSEFGLGNSHFQINLWLDGNVTKTIPCKTKKEQKKNFETIKNNLGVIEL